VQMADAVAQLQYGLLPQPQQFAQMINGGFRQSGRSRTLLSGKAGNPESVDSVGFGSR
jgi:hypothetical protein